MGLFQDADAIGKMVKDKQILQKKLDETKEQAKEEVVKEQEQHEKNKEQGMI